MLRVLRDWGEELVDGRRMMLAGGAMTAVATVAVGGFVAVSSTAALADAPGQPVNVASIVVPSPSVSSTAAPVLEAAPATAPMPEIVPAPEPDDVATPVDPAPAPPAPGPSAAAPAPPAVEPGTDPADALARAREWAAAQGWDAERIKTWLAELQAQYGDGRLSQSQIPVDSTGSPSDPEYPSSRFGSREEQSSVSSSPDD